MTQNAIIDRIRATLALILGDFCRWVLRTPPKPRQRTPIPSGKYPSLDRAFLRVDRAEKHIADFVRRTRQRGQEQINSIAFESDPNSPEYLRPNKPHSPLDPIFSVIIGEIAYNLRAALDYLIFEIAALDSGCIIDGTQFPIESSKKRFKWCVRNGWLDGLNAAHVAAIEALQPYRGNQWAIVLKNLSNPDKHRGFIPSQVQHELTFHAVDEANLEDARFREIPGAIRLTIRADGVEVYVKAILSTSIQFTDGTPVIQTLQEIKSQVARVLEAFKPDFERGRDAPQDATPL
jgi:hypothetical protein